ncbi:2'-5' RNA ligase family protein [Bacillus sp. BRMEA1]|uniref:2'-5' RNA ligase family protein n=1 Tax=Neobacillus endophyticus TaxID=2738405 RepID=UPI0015679EC7|nr:2'-5' RNA ligase family protein [Neobacillus endophyticus]NRD79858.1 2'-5' RNA ligase family protein [Neobacillus endophyticus]
MQRAIHIFPEFKNMNMIEGIRKKYDPLFGLVQPHITLVFPFESEIPSSILEKNIKNALAGVNPFPLYLKGITGSLNNYLFLNVKKGNDNIIELHDRLYSGPLFDFISRKHTYFPHLTVGRLKNDNDLLNAINDTRSFEECFETTVNEITSEIIESNGDSTFDFKVSL